MLTLEQVKFMIDKTIKGVLSDFMTSEQVEPMVEKAIKDAFSTMRPFKLFGLNGSKEYATEVAKYLKTEVTPHEERIFEDGEPYVKSINGISGNVRGHNVFVIQSLYSDQKESVSEKFIKLCIMCSSLRDASAHEVTAIIPHLAWARQDRKTESRAPITTKYIARMLESCGINRALFLDLHSLSAEQNAFNVPIDNLEAKNLFADWCCAKLIEEKKTKKIRVLSPDSGGLGRCNRFRLALLNRLNSAGIKLDDIEIVIFDKLRIKGVVHGGRIIGDIENSDVILLDDIISTGGTINSAYKAAVNQGGRIFAVCATHGLFCGNANSFLDNIKAHIVVTDSVSPFRLNENNLKKLHVISTTKMMADAILRIHSGSGSISQLLK